MIKKERCKVCGKLIALHEAKAHWVTKHPWQWIKLQGRLNAEMARRLYYEGTHALREDPVGPHHLETEEV